MALSAAGWRLLRTAPSASPLLAPHPRVPSGMVHSRRTCHCHSGGDGRRSVRAEGWVGGREGRKASSTACHCSAAAAAAPKPHREQTPFPPAIIVHPRRREDRCLLRR